MKYIQYHDVGAKLILATALMGAQAVSAPGILRDLPISLGVEPQPNILMLVDDSGSMDREVLRTDGGNGTGVIDFTPNWRADDSSDGFRSPLRDILELCRGYNAMAYDPNVTYTPWAGNDINGNVYTNKTLTTGLYDPYDPSRDGSDGFSGDPDEDELGDSVYVSGPRDLTGHFYIVWDDDGDGVFEEDEGECATIDSGIDLPPSLGSDGILTAEFCKSQTNTCFAVKDLPVAQQQNYANWYTYHRKRQYIVKAALSGVISTSDERVGLATIWRRNSVGVLVKDIDDTEGDATARANKNDLLDNVFRITPRGGTPLRNALDRVGQYFTIGESPGTDLFGNHEPINHSTTETESSDSPILRAEDGGICQQNYSIVFSDGFWSGDHEGTGNTDGDNNTDYDGGTFADPYSNTLADIAMKYYEQDLAPSLANFLELDDLRLDGVTVNHQNMVTYTVNFGVNGSLSANPDEAGFTSWPEPIARNPTAGDDMRHAAWNGRGRFLSASDTVSLNNAFEEIFNDIEERSGGVAASAAFSSGRISAETLLFQSEFETETWSGDLLAFTFDDDGVGNTSLWSASERARLALDANGWQNRNIFTYNGLSGVPFEFPSNYSALLADGDSAAAGELSDSQIIDLLTEAPNNYVTANADEIVENQAYGESIVDYFKGDSSNEVVDGVGQFRFRDGNYLGAFVHSGPQYVGEPSEPYPDLIEGPGKEYSSFVNELRANPRTPVVYIGGNGGMLHGFNGAVGGGQEIFSYIPGIIGNELHDLAEPNYSYQAYVDATPSIRDVYIDNSWRTYLVGAMRSGGKGVYVLDVTDPSLLNANDAATVVKSEFTDDDLGFTFSRPQIVKLNHDGRWAAIFGNGYNADGDGTAKLYVLYLDNGDFVKLETNSGSIVNNSCFDPDSDCNGLSSPSVADLDGDFRVDRVYAGDVHGNMWAFDLSGSTPASWSGTKLFTASTSASCTPTRDNGCRQSITTRPEISAHPSRRSSSTSPNILVYFGTGQAIAQGDSGNNDVQSFYGVWDATIGDANYSGLTKADLQRQQFTEEFGVTNNPVSYTPAVSGGNFGWYHDLVIPTNNVFEGGRVSIDPLLLGDIIFFVVGIPDNSPLCVPESAGVASYLVALEAFDGTESDFLVFDTDNDGIADHSDPVNEQDSVLVGLGSIEDKIVTTGAEGKIEDKDVITKSFIAPGRKSWSIIK